MKVLATLCPASKFFPDAIVASNLFEMRLVIETMVTQPLPGTYS
jgi:hypothetical protein